MPHRPNILFLLSDEHSFRCVGHRPANEGGEPVSTPTLDGLAAGGTVFSDAYCQMPLCTPSRLCLLTGREVRGAGAWSNQSVLRPALPTLPGTFADAGYATCLVGKMHLGAGVQFGGFQHRPYGDLTGRCGHQWEPIDSDERHGMRTRTTGAGVTQIPESLLQDQVVSHETVAWLREHQAASPEQPWFCCASFSRPHFPLTAPRRHLDHYWPDRVTEPPVPATGDAYDHPMSVGMRKGFRADDIAHEEMMRARAAYFACVSYLDEVIGDLFTRLDRAGLLDNTIVVYTTDHGELAGEHGVWWKNGWYEGCTRVPLLVSLPEQRHGTGAPQTCRTPMALVDLFPTLCGLADIACPSGLDGCDLSAAVRDPGQAPDRPVFCDNLIPRWGTGTEFRMIRQGDYKYVVFRDAPELLFNVVVDPGEQHNLVDSTDPADRAALAALRQVAADTMDFDAAEHERTERDGSLHQRYALGIEDKPQLSCGNLYIFPDGRLVDAETTIYRPNVLADNAAGAFVDWPTSS